MIPFVKKSMMLYAFLRYFINGYMAYIQATKHQNRIYETIIILKGAAPHLHHGSTDRHMPCTPVRPVQFTHNIQISTRVTRLPQRFRMHLRNLMCFSPRIHGKQFLLLNITRTIPEKPCMVSANSNYTYPVLLAACSYPVYSA